MSNKKWIRNCLVCNKEIIYICKSSFYSARKANKPCFSCAITNRKTRVFSEKEKSQAREQLVKVTNTRPLYDIWLEKFGKKIADQKLQAFKDKQSINQSGINNTMYGKPAPQGSGNGWSGWYKGWYFRSLRELSFMINIIEKQNLQWRTPDKEFKISYVDYKGDTRNYFPDFIINENKIIEVKPLKLHNTPKVLAKKLAAEKFCLNNQFTYEIVDPPILNEEQIKELYESGQIKFLEKYDNKFKERYSNV